MRINKKKAVTVFDKVLDKWLKACSVCHHEFSADPEGLDNEVKKEAEKLKQEFTYAMNMPKKEL